MKMMFAVLASLIALLAVIFLFSCQEFYKTRIGVQLSNKSSTAVEVREAYVDSKRIKDVVPTVVLPNTDFFRSNQALSLGLHMSPGRLLIVSSPGNKELLSCEISGAEPGELCVLRLDVSAPRNGICYCDSSSDFAY